MKNLIYNKYSELIAGSQEVGGGGIKLHRFFL
jgi:hypothetical protein